MKSTGKRGEVMSLEAEVVIVGGSPEQGTATSVSSNSSSDEDEDNSRNGDPQSYKHLQAHTVDVEENQNEEGTSPLWSDTNQPSSPRAVIVDKCVTASTTREDQGRNETDTKSTSSAAGNGQKVQCNKLATTEAGVTIAKRNRTNTSQPCCLTKGVTDPTGQRSKSLPIGVKKQTSRTTIGDSSEITTIREFAPEQANTVGSVLRFCKRRVLFPYLKLLGVMGLKPLHSEGDDTGMWTLIMSKLYLVLVGIVLIMGYSLQYMTCFRRDQGFSYKEGIKNPPMSLHDKYDYYEDALPGNSSIGRQELLKSNELEPERWLLEDTICTGNVIYVYLIPSMLHIASFLYMVYLYWIYDDEHLQNLLERVFIQAAHANINVFSQQRLIRRLQGLVGVGCLWIVLITACQILHVFFTKIYFNVWMELEYNMTYAMSSLMLFATLWQDAIQVTIVISFTIQCSLICTYTELIKGRLMQHSITLSECMKELGELGQLLSYLNDDLALGLAPLLIIDGVYAAGALVQLIQNGNQLEIQYLVLLVISAILWIFIIVFPLAQAASVSTCCQKLKDMGHMIRIRPFGYQFVSQSDLDSFLLFASNLHLKASILKVPITSPILAAVAITLFICFLLWGYFQ